MHNLRLFLDNPALLRQGLERRGALETYEPALNRAIELGLARKTLIQRLEAMQAKHNTVTAEIARRKQQKETSAELDALQAEARAMARELPPLQEARKTLEQELEEILFTLPNVTLPDVPAGGEEANIPLRTWGTPNRAQIPPHWEIAQTLGLLDPARGAKVTGAGFLVYRQSGARLARALKNFMLDLHTSRGYEEVSVPSLVNATTARGTGQLPKMAEDMYETTDGLFMIPTAEVPVTNLYQGEIITETLPRGYVACTQCFRREAGAAGKDTRGLLRMHEFEKVELVRYTTPEESMAAHEQLTRDAEEVLRQLGLPYRVLLLAAGDTGFASAKTYDLEVWAPGVGKWLEVSSASNFLDFQARRANIRYRPDGGGKPEYIHTLNASGLALPRTIAAILENGYQPDGTVVLPDCLVPYMGGIDRLKPLVETLKLRPSR